MLSEDMIRDMVLGIDSITYSATLAKLLGVTNAIVLSSIVGVCYKNYLLNDIRKGEFSVSELSERLGLTESEVVSAIFYLEDRGAIEIVENRCEKEFTLIYLEGFDERI